MGEDSAGEMESVVFNSDYPTILGKHIWCACVESGVNKARYLFTYLPSSTLTFSFPG